MMNLNKTEAPSTPRMMNHETYHEYIVFKNRRQNNRKTDSQTESIQIYRAINQLDSKDIFFYLQTSRQIDRSIYIDDRWYEMNKYVIAFDTEDDSYYFYGNSV